MPLSTQILPLSPLCHVLYLPGIYFRHERYRLLPLAILFLSTPTLPPPFPHRSRYFGGHPPHSFHESVQLHEPGYAKWLRTHAPGSLDGADLAETQEAFSNWPLLHHGELKYVDTPAGVSMEQAL